VLGLKGTMSEALWRIRHKASYADHAVMPTGSGGLVVASVVGVGCSA
jgi:hypothetical protein